MALMADFSASSSWQDYSSLVSFLSYPHIIYRVKVS